MNQLYAIPTAPQSCFEALGTAPSNKCATPQLSEIRQLILSDTDPATGQALYKPSGDVSVEGSWTGVIDNDAAAAAKRVTGSGDIPAGPETTVVVNGVPVPITKERVINFDVVAFTDEQNELFRKMQHGWRGFVWALTREGRIVGGETGIDVQCTMCEPDYTRGNEAVKMWKIKLIWYAKISPPDNASPFTVFN